MTRKILTAEERKAKKNEYSKKYAKEHPEERQRIALQNAARLKVKYIHMADDLSDDALVVLYKLLEGRSSGMGLFEGDTDDSVLEELRSKHIIHVGISDNGWTMAQFEPMYTRKYIGEKQEHVKELLQKRGLA